MPEMFRRSKPPALRQREQIAKRERFRGSARERGYTTEWDRLRGDYIEIHPTCEECLRRGYVRQADVVDHMIPVADAPDRRLDRENLDSLCHDHHNGWKRRLEQFARATGQLDELPYWIKQPALRPAGFAIYRTGPVKQDVAAQ